MYCRRLLSSLYRRQLSVLSSHFPNSKTLTFLSLSSAETLNPLLYSPNSHLDLHPHLFFSSQFSSSPRNFSTKDDHNDEDDTDGDDDDEDDDDDDEDEDGEEEKEELEESSGVSGNKASSSSNCIVERSKEEKEEAAEIGYEVLGPLHPSDRPFKPWEPVFAVVQVGSHQFKVCNGDAIYAEKLKHCEVNDKLVLKKVLMLGSKSQTIIGRPILPEAAVHAVVEEHMKDAKVIIFKKKRRKNYRRTKGHRQALTRLRITDIQGIEKPQKESVAA